ncbi:MCE family protein [Nocardia goodfellowii]|uniref:Phospholipid/cholesterol/gamma-HCH transport system substrate-binding protein n=1 Tax=Nocardia goodfellowii TaxID=882446 RepID=A0ABS4QJM2_9NOCA|nr:MCE family protein [Nocardia goodfellowii]MBP2191909.1 phospholipid/cholesterol/gamma-HCH transport system substrate-binding protein [Nocardia goodfellowii]
MNAQRNGPLLKFGVFAAVMLVLSGVLIVVFSNYRAGAAEAYSADFIDSSGLRAGDTVRIAGVRVGTVRTVTLRADHQVTVEFETDRGIALTDGTRVAIRYLNLVGDRYLELTEGPGSTALLQPGARIPAEKTMPALDLDLLLGGLKPVIQGLNARDVNAFTWSLLEIMQGREGTMDSLLSKTASFTTALADNGTVVQQLIDNLNTVMRTLSQDGAQFGLTIDRLEQLVTQLSQDRDPIGAAIIALENGTASVADLLTQARPPLAGTIDQLARLAPALDADRLTLEQALQRAPENFRKMARTGTYGNFIQYYMCQLTVRVSDPSGEVVVLPAVTQDSGRCVP